jgi:site-specific recombinase XerC
MNELIALEKIAQWQKLKALVLDSVSSPITKRVYNMALNEFMAWFQQMPRAGFTKDTVSAWRVSLEDRRLGSSSIIIRMSAIRKLAAEAADNGLLAPELAQGISRVKSVKSTGIRVGNWLSQRQAQALLSAPDISTLCGLRDRAILAVLLGCGLRRSEVAALTFTHMQQRHGRWCIVDLVGKHGRVTEALATLKTHKPEALEYLSAAQQTEPMESVLKGSAIELWSTAAGRLFLVADEVDARHAMERFGARRGEIYTAEEARRIIAVNDPAVVAEIHDWKRRFDGVVREFCPGVGGK